MSDLKQHPLSAAFPPMLETDFQALKDSIENIGVQNPITLYEGMVIDGWHRYSAATAAGLDCPMVDLGDVDPRDFVLAQNKARRHVTQAQLALATTAVFAWKPAGNPAFSQSDTECPIGKSNAQLAEAAGVSEMTIKQAKAVQTKAAPEVVEAVKRGEIGLPKAAAIAKLPKEEQAAAIRQPSPKRAAPPASGIKTSDAPSDVTDGRSIEPDAETHAHAEELQQAQQAQFSALREEVDALREQLREVQADNASIAQILDANDQLSAAMDEAKRERDLARGLQARVNSLMTQVADLKRQVAHWKKKAGG